MKELCHSAVHNQYCLLWRGPLTSTLNVPQYISAGLVKHQQSLSTILVLGLTACTDNRSKAAHTLPAMCLLKLDSMYVAYRIMISAKKPLPNR